MLHKVFNWLSCWNIDCSLWCRVHFCFGGLIHSFIWFHEPCHCIISLFGIVVNAVQVLTCYIFECYGLCLQSFRIYSRSEISIKCQHLLAVLTENMPYFTMPYRPIVIESNLALKGKILFYRYFEPLGKWLECRESNLTELLLQRTPRRQRLEQCTIASWLKGWCLTNDRCTSI